MPKPAVSLTEALQRYDRESERDGIELAEKERRAVVDRFPRADWPSLPLERYALGQDKKHDTFCWWMEWGTQNVCSMRGGSAAKHIVFRRPDGSWYFDQSTYTDVGEAWKAVRDGFVEAFEKAEAEDWNGIEEIAAINAGPALRTKALYCYFPDRLLPITSRAHLKHFLEQLGHPDRGTGYETVPLNRRLLAIVREMPEFEAWESQQVVRFLYNWTDPRDQRRVVKIAPGSNAMYWDECLRGGFIAVGWSRIGDLRDFESKEAFRVKFDETFGEMHKDHQPTISKKANEVWTLRELEPGDLVVANQGTSRVLAVGEVDQRAYEFRPNAVGVPEEFAHIVHVKWDTSYEQEVPPQKSWAMATVVPLRQFPLFEEIGDALERRGQVVLYGPPGTGKTYTARRFAVWWLSSRGGDDGKREAARAMASPDAFAEAERRLSTASVGRRAWWMVARAADWRWEQLFKDQHVDFRYGRLERNYPLVAKGDVVFGYQSTPDKRLAAVARVSQALYTDEQGERKIDLEPLAPIEHGLSYEELKGDPVLSKSEPLRHRCQGTLFSLTEDETDYLVELLTERAPLLGKQLGVADGEGSKGGIGPLTRLTFHPSYTYEDFVEGFRPTASEDDRLVLTLQDGVFKRVCREAQARPDRPYLVLIDEINRANVAKVFGELITLLEYDKRGLTVALPQSREPFNIPPNVYVLGTMNTADRSIRLLDAAMRRRFAFVELMPNMSLLAGGRVGNLALDDFLVELNRRVAAKEGREKQIGHSFLLEGENPLTDVAEFARRFRQEIMPLLQEYCYDDYGALADYVGETLVNRQAQALDDELLRDPDRLVEALEESFRASPPAGAEGAA